MTSSEERDVRNLRFDARLAYLDGRVKRARQLNRKADLILRRDLGFSAITMEGNSLDAKLRFAQELMASK